MIKSIVVLLGILLFGPAVAEDCMDGLVEVDGACVVPSDGEPDPEMPTEPEVDETVYSAGEAPSPPYESGYAHGMSGGPSEEPGWD